MNTGSTIDIPYQKHSNKKLFDYILTCCNQLNNVNFAQDVSDTEAKEKNQIYFCIDKQSVYLFVCLSYKNNNNFFPLVEIWTELNDVTVNKDVSDFKIYKFNVQKFHSLLSFASNYKERDHIILNIKDDLSTLYYLIADTAIEVDVAKAIDDNTELAKNIRNSWFLCKNNTIDNIEYNDISITNVDKNSFLLPYFNHKNCLCFTVASTDNYTCLSCFDDNYYIQNILIDKDTLSYASSTLLRKDRFTVHQDCLPITFLSPGLWQILTILQCSKVWKNFNFSKSKQTGALVFDEDFIVYHHFNNVKEVCFDTLIDMNNFEIVGKLSSNEIFILNKLFTNSKNSYFDFSRQKFIGIDYIFSDDNNDDNTKQQEIDLLYKCESTLPLKITFTELKYYVGSDLSQKDFILVFKTDGVYVIIERWDITQSTLENVVLFNHTMSKKYLNI